VVVLVQRLSSHVGGSGVAKIVARLLKSCFPSLPGESAFVQSGVGVGFK